MHAQKLYKEDVLRRSRVQAEEAQQLAALRRSRFEETAQAEAAAREQIGEAELGKRKAETIAAGKAAGGQVAAGGGWGAASAAAESAVVLASKSSTALARLRGAVVCNEGVERRAAVGAEDDDLDDAAIERSIAEINAAIRRTALMTVEGERDDICAVGQTVAAQDLCSSIRPYKKTHHVQTGVGHYGVFSGRKWNQQIYPRVREMIHASEG